MLYSDVLNLTPSNWSSMTEDERFAMVEITDPSEIKKVMSHLQGNYYKHALEIYRVQNPYLYAKFQHQLDFYQQVGEVEIKPVFHDTSIWNAKSICEFNFDWKLGTRFKYGPGVYFSKKPDWAFKHSRRDDGTHRAMFVVDVLLQNVQQVNGEIFLCDLGYDTVLAHNNQTYVKYFDGDYYPKYFMRYISQSRS